MQLLDGRYGPYVTDGETNASLPKDTPAESLTFPDALSLLAARAELGPPKKKKFAKKRAASAPTAKAKPTSKSAAKRRPAKAVKSSKKKS